MVNTLLEFLTAWGAQCGDSNFLQHFDFNNNCRIDSSDLVQLLAKFAEQTTETVKSVWSRGK